MDNQQEQVLDSSREQKHDDSDKGSYYFVLRIGKGKGKIFSLSI
jgi:hypothetical protein